MGLIAIQSHDVRPLVWPICVRSGASSKKFKTNFNEDVKTHEKEMKIIIEQNVIIAMRLVR